MEEQARPPSPQLPEPQRILSWVYLGRLFLAGALLLRAPWIAAESLWLEIAAIAFLPVVVLFTGASFWYSHGGGRRPRGWFLLGQLIFDAVLLTAVVHHTGSQDSFFAPLYILLICAASLLLPVVSGMLVAVLGILLYLGSIALSGQSVQSGSVWLQISLFAIVGVAIWYLGERLRATGVALGEVQTELRQLRLDTGDILNTVSTGVLTVDGEGRLAYLNPAATEILSLSAEEWVGQPILERLDEIAPGLGEVIARSARDRIAVRRFETESVADDAFVLGVSTTLVDRSTDATPAITAIFQDITEKMRVEGLRRRAERLEAVAELSASLAHEIKNPLASIRSAVEQIAGGGVDEEDAQLLRGLVVRESDRLSRLLTEFIDFARVKVTAPQPVDFFALVRHVVDLVRAHPDAQPTTVKLRVVSPHGSVRIRGAEDLLHRAVFNLVLNGAQWAGEGGRVELTLDEVRSDLLSPALGALSLVRLTVADTGPGVPDDIVEHIFDPFFTRRPGGTGLGLALVQRAVEAHGGAIFVDNAPAHSGFGAMFTLYLPALPPDAPAGVATPENEESSSF